MAIHHSINGSRKGHPESASTREKISAKLKGKAHPHKGHAQSAATRAKISGKLKGHHRSSG